MIRPVQYLVASRLVELGGSLVHFRDIQSLDLIVARVLEQKLLRFFDLIATEIRNAVGEGTLKREPVILEEQQ